jgi:non-ribosomal peptide synthetase component F
MQLPLKQEVIQAKCFHPSGKFVEFPKQDVETSIQERFEQIAGRFPDRVAVKMRNRTLTYQELNQAANRLAHAILAQRGESQEPIALLMDHDIPLIVAIVGVLKAGKICVVLDPSYPKDRSVFLLEDSQASLLITDSENLCLAIECARDRCGFVNINELDSGFSIDNPGLPISPDRFAFLIYTSGSTGQPKGVIQNHRNLLHDSLLYCNGLHICTDDRIALLYSCSTSQGLKITFATLLNGAALYPFNIRQNGVADLALWLNQDEITIYFSVPVIFRHFCQYHHGTRKVSASADYSIGIGLGNTQRARRIPKALFCGHHSDCQIGCDRDRHLAKNVLQHGKFPRGGQECRGVCNRRCGHFFAG